MIGVIRNILKIIIQYSRRIYRESEAIISDSIFFYTLRPYYYPTLLGRPIHNWFFFKNVVELCLFINIKYF